MKVAGIIKQEIAKRGFTNLKDAAEFLGVSTELLRMLVNKGRMPKDRLLSRIADRLGLDRVSLILTAHKERVPREMHGFFLEPKHPAGAAWETRRKWPLSQEQCDYLSQIMSDQEIQLIRKYRQLNGEQRTQALGYIDYHFEAARQADAPAKPAVAASASPPAPAAPAPEASPVPARALKPETRKPAVA